MYAPGSLGSALAYLSLLISMEDCGMLCPGFVPTCCEAKILKGPCGFQCIFSDKGPSLRGFKRGFDQ
jgi:hypothetical protein